MEHGEIDGGQRLEKEAPAERGRNYENRLLSRREALKRIGLTFGGLSFLGLNAVVLPEKARATINVNAMDDPDSGSENEKCSSYIPGYYYYYSQTSYYAKYYYSYYYY